jgi:Tol biopolymer transport system component
MFVAVAACAPAAGFPAARTAAPDATRARIVFAADAASPGSDPRRAIFSVDLDGSRLVRLTHDPTHDLFAPAWSPDHRRIAYVHDRAVYVMDANGRGTRRITTSGPGEGPAIDPAWSPDGTRIAYADWAHIHTVRAAGGGLRTVTAGPGTVHEPAWSPDGRFLAYTSCNGGDRQGDCEIYLVGADGKDRRRLIGGEPCARPRVAPWSLLDAYAPAWSRDGKRIAYVTSCFIDNNWPSPGIIETIRPDGRGRTVVARPAGPAPSGGDLAQWSGNGAAELAWSPDGTRLVVALGASSIAYGSRFRLGLVTVAGGALTPLLPGIESPSLLGPDW